jgi:hypothetical protein
MGWCSAPYLRWLSGLLKSYKNSALRWIATFLCLSLVSTAVAGVTAPSESVRRFNFLGYYGNVTGQWLESLLDADFFFSKIGKAKGDPYPYSLLDLVRTRRPGAKVLVYEIGYGRAESQTDWAEVSQHEEWFLHEGGNRLKQGNYWLMDLGHPGYIDHLVTFNAQVAQKYGYDGVFLDNLFCQTWLKKSIGCERFERSAERLMKGFKQQNPELFIMYNGLRVGWADANGQYLKWADGIFVEKFCNHDCERLQDPRTTIAYVKRLRELDRTGKTVLVNARYLCEATPPALDQPQVQRYCRYCLAAYLTSMGDHTFYRVNLLNPKVPQSNIGIREQPVPLGRPLGEPTIRDGVYIRDFAYGQVFWNPSERDVDFKLNSSLFTLAGHKIQQVKLEKRSGVILFNHNPGR